MEISRGVLESAEAFVREHLQHNDASHDIDHILRVRNMAVRIAAAEGLSDQSRALVELAALLHDVFDWKYGGTPAQTQDSMQALLTAQGLPADSIDEVVNIIQRVGFKEELKIDPSSTSNSTILPTGCSNPAQPAASSSDPGACSCTANTNTNTSSSSGGSNAGMPLSIEAAVVQDADRLDAIGAIGIARCFTFGGAFRRVLHDPGQPPRLDLTKQQYMGGQSTTINHFYEKLLKLQGMMKTAEGRRIAAERHAFMDQFLQQFHAEWLGDA